MPAVALYTIAEVERKGDKEAPLPFLTFRERVVMYESSKLPPGYYGFDAPGPAFINAWSLGYFRRAMDRRDYSIMLARTRMGSLPPFAKTIALMIEEANK